MGVEFGLTLKEEHRLRGFEKKSTENICTEERLKWREGGDNCITKTGHVAQMGEKKTMYKLLVGKPEGKNH
jgi:porphobilinogen deaminase